MGKICRPHGHRLVTSQPEVPTQGRRRLANGGVCQIPGVTHLPRLDTQVFEVWELQSELHDSSVGADRADKPERGDSGVELYKTSSMMACPNGAVVVLNGKSVNPIKSPEMVDLR